VGGALVEVLLPVLVGLALVGLAAVVLRSGRSHRHNAFFAALYLLSGLKSVSEGLAVMADDFHAEAPLFPPRLFWDLLGTFCALGMLPLLFLFVSSFPHPARWLQRSPRLAPLAFLPSALVAAALLGAVVGLVSAGTFAGAAQGFNILFFAVTLSAVLLLLRTRSRSPDPVERTQALYVFLGFVPGFTMGWVISGLQLGEALGLVAPGQGQQAVGLILHILSPVAELLAASLVAFAILRYNILGISPRFRLGVKSVVAGLMFVALFFLTQFVENVILQGKVFSFAGDYGSFILSGATGIVLFKPIETVSDRVSSRLLPAAAAHEQASAAGAAVAAAALHAEQIYHAQATYVLRDAKVTDRELAFLANLRTQLGLSPETARRIEEEVERILKVDVPETGASAAPASQPPT
jgi:hypothetical protein